MHWEDKGYLLSKIKYSENAVISEIFTKNHGKISGVIYGATSKKIKNYLQIGNKLHVNYNYKNDDKIGYFKIEIDKILTPLFFEERKKLACIVSTLNLIKILTVESQENINIFKSINSFFNILHDYNWIKNYIFWELKFYKLIGYDLALKNIILEDTKNNKKIYYVESKNTKKIVPNFLIDLDINPKNKDDLLSGLQLVSDYLDKSILRPNNINYPKLRTEFINMLK
tara:strand:+ start:2486 stop:3166 length:681 start_codon:yes stop_codon:yes gene_type:complete